MRPPYHPDCPDCRAVEAYLDDLRRRVNEVDPVSGKPILVDVTIRASDVPTCARHLGDDF